MRLSAMFSSLAFSALTITLTGCGVSGTVPSANIAIRGNVHGGQQPIVGSTIQLWAAGTMDTSGNVTAPSQLLQSGVTTDNTGAFNITGNYHCPSSNSQVYLTARGGDAGAGPNPQIVLMSLLGSCSSLTPSTFAFLNEETTVIAAEVVVGTTDATFDANDNITGTKQDNGASLATAFSLALEYVNPTTGVVPGPAAPDSSQNFVASVNTFADILAACVNSRGGVAGDHSVCGDLFSETTYPGGTGKNNQPVAAGPTPTDTLQAIIDYTYYSLVNGGVGLSFGTNLYMLIPSNPPYLPDLQSTPAPLLPSGVSILTATASGDGIVHVPASPGQSAAFAVEVQDSAAAGMNLLLSTSTLASTAASATICQTNPNTGQCLTAPASTLPFVTDTSGSYVFSVFVTASAPIASSPFYVNLTDSNGNLLGSTSVTVTTN